MASSFRRSYRMSGGQQGIVKIQLVAWREQMLNRLLPWTTLIATGAIIVGSVSVAERGSWFYLPLYVTVYLVLVVLTVAKRITYLAKARVLMLLIAALGISVLAETGLRGVGRPFLLILPIAAVVLLDWRFSLAGLGLGTGALLVYGFSQHQVLDSVLAATINAMLATGVIISVHTIIGNLSTAVAEEQRSRERENDINDHLERKTGQQKSELERRSKQLAMVVAFGELVNEVLDPAMLSDRAAMLLVERCDLVGATLYLMEDGGRTAVLHAAAGDAAGRLLEESRVVQVGERSLLGWCLESGEPQIRHDSDYLFHPTIPESRSALVLAVRAGGRVMGAIELHASYPGAFDEQMVMVLQSAASLVGLALESLGRSECGRPWQGDMTETAGRASSRTGQRVGQRGAPLFAEYHARDVPAWSADEVSELVAEEKVVTIPLGSDGDRRGHLVIEAADGEGFAAELDLEFLQGVACQVGAALENAQLFEETRRRAAYGQLMTEMSARVRSSLDPDTILKTTVRELGRVLGAKLTTVEVATPVSRSSSPADGDPEPLREAGA
jgi:GAF domain-containing protein